MWDKFKDKFEGIVRWTEELDAYVDRRVAEGATYAVIGGELGISVSAIAGRLNRRGQQSEQTRAAAALRVVEHNIGDPRVTQEGCRWVIGEPTGAWHWCGKPIARGPYCAEHEAQSKIPRGDARR